MILSKANLLVVELTKDSKDIAALNNIHICKDGMTVGASNDIIVCVSPVTDEVKENVIFNESKVNDDITIPANTAKEILKNIPSDKKFGGILEHCDLNEKYVICKDGIRERKISLKLYTFGFIKFKQILKRIFGYSRKDTSTRVILNMQRLATLLNTLLKMCPDSTGENPVFIEFTNRNDIILRTVNQKTGQRVIGTMTSFKNVNTQWLEPDKWEKRLTKIKQKMKEVKK